MAWGGQGAGKSKRFAAEAWRSREQIAEHLTKLRAGNLSRTKAYELFLDDGNIRGLGPAYFTKLLYFFSPTCDFYIMDQWTAKSVNLLNSRHIVLMSGHAVSGLNTGANYVNYCNEVETIAGLLAGGISGEDAEEMLMSKGGRKPWQWRAHLRASWP